MRDIDIVTVRKKLTKINKKNKIYLGISDSYVGN